MILEMLIGGSIYSAKTAHNNKKANDITITSLERISESKKNLNEAEKYTEQKIDKLLKRKQGIYNTSIRRFIDQYEIIKKVNFPQKEGITELLSGNLSLHIDEVKRISISINENKKNDNELLIGYILFGVIGFSFMTRNNSKVSLRSSEILSMESKHYSKSVENFIIFINKIGLDCDRISKLLAELNYWFTLSVKHTEKIILQCGANPYNYSKEDRDDIMVCMSLFKVMIDYLNVPILDSENELNQKLVAILAKENEIINDFKKKVNNL